MVSDFTTQNQLVTYLPRGVYNPVSDQYELLLMITGSDALGGISNITKVISVAPDPSVSLQAKINNLNTIFTQSQSLSTENKIPVLNLLSLEITRMEENGCNSTASTCSGHGSCTSVNDTACTCTDGYYLKDCSANDAIYTSYLNLKKQIYDQCNLLKGNSTSQALND